MSSTPTSSSQMQPQQPPPQQQQQQQQQHPMRAIGTRPPSPPRSDDRIRELFSKLAPNHLPFVSDKELMTILSEVGMPYIYEKMKELKLCILEQKWFQDLGDKLNFTSLAFPADVEEYRDRLHYEERTDFAFWWKRNCNREKARRFRQRLKTDEDPSASTPDSAARGRGRLPKRESLDQSGAEDGKPGESAGASDGEGAGAEGAGGEDADGRKRRRGRKPKAAAAAKSGGEETGDDGTPARKSGQPDEPYNYRPIPNPAFSNVPPPYDSRDPRPYDYRFPTRDTYYDYPHPQAPRGYPPYDQYYPPGRGDVPHHAGYMYPPDPFRRYPPGSQPYASHPHAPGAPEGAAPDERAAAAGANGAAAAATTTTSTSSTTSTTTTSTLAPIVTPRPAAGPRSLSPPLPGSEGEQASK